MSRTLETIIQEIKTLTEFSLIRRGHLDSILKTCNRVISLKGAARIETVILELNIALFGIHEYIEKLKKLVAEVNEKSTRY